MVKFNWIFFGAAGTLFLAIATFNYFVDPAGLFSANDDFEALIVSNLSKKNLIISQNIFDDRKMAKIRLNDISQNDKKIIVTGSSRAHLIGNATLGTKDVLNLSTSGARFEDHLSIGYLASKSMGIRKIIFALDPWVFNEFAKDYRITALNNDFKLAQLALGDTIVEDGGWRTQLNQYTQLINYAYTAESWKKYKAVRKRNQRNPFDNNSDVNGVPERGFALIRQDGTRVFNFSHKEKPDEISNAAGLLTRSFLFSDRNADLLIELIKKIQKRNIEVVFFLPPYRSDAYAIIKREGLLVPNVERRIRFMAQDLGVRVYGSYDGSLPGCSDGDFLDALHPKDVCIIKIFKTN